MIAVSGAKQLRFRLIWKRASVDGALMSGTMVVYVRYKSLYISLSSSAQQQPYLGERKRRG